MELNWIQNQRNQSLNHVLWNVRLRTYRWSCHARKPPATADNCVCNRHSTLMSVHIRNKTQKEFLIEKGKLEFQFELAADKAVDTFFCISGILMSYTTINKLRKGKTGFSSVAVKTPLFTFLRFLRLTPMYSFVIFFYATVVPHMGSGPLWYVDTPRGACSTRRLLHARVALCR